MEKIFNTSNTIRDIVTQFPRASDVFKQYRIDFCCGGNRPLIEAIKEKHLNEDEFMQKLQQRYEDTIVLREQDVNWEEIPHSELVEHIVSTHHAYLTDELPKLSQFVNRILRVHGKKHGHLLQVHHLFHQLKMEVEQHMVKEEHTVFPLIKEYHHYRTPSILQRLRGAIQMLEEEHGAAGDVLKEMRKVTNDYLPPEGACTTYQLAYRRLEDLESDLFQHIHLENNILFPCVQREWM